jgi:hypothetical protein
VNSLAALGGEDYLDPYFVSGLRGSHRWGPAGGSGVDLTARWERHETATLVVDAEGSGMRPIRRIEDGWLRAFDVGVDAPGLPSWATVRADTRLARMNGRTYATGQTRARVLHEGVDRALEVELELRAGAAEGDAPPQELYVLGGRGTLPGHPFRELVGNRFWLVSARAGRVLRAPWVEAHVFGAVGRAWLAGRDAIPGGWAGTADAGTRASLGVGVDLLWEVLRLDLARGLGEDGDWEVVLEISPRFHPWL